MLPAAMTLQKPIEYFVPPTRGPFGSLPKREVLSVTAMMRLF